jgi:hypothetical protein
MANRKLFAATDLLDSAGQLSFSDDSVVSTSSDYVVRKSGDGSENISLQGHASAYAAGSTDNSQSTPVGAAFAPETVTLAGSGLTFINTYDASVASDYHTAILFAEHELESHFANAVTIRVNFGFANLGAGFLAQNSFFNTVNASYATLKNALTSHATSADDIAAVNALPASAPSNMHSSSANTGFLVAAGMARVLGLEGASSSLDDSLVLGSAFTWNFDPNNRSAPGGFDAIGAIEHEISEGGMGRVGGLGYQNNTWGPMDLFRFNSAGTRDVTGGQDGVTTYFSPNGSNVDLNHPFHSSVNGAGTFDGQDPADWGVGGDSFGFGSPGVPGLLSATDLRVMDVLGWTALTQDNTAPVLANDNPLAIAVGATATITSSLLSFNDPDNTHAQLSYSVVTAPSSGTLLKNGSATSSFTQDDIDNNRITYHENGQIVSSDSFSFTVSDPAGNHTATTQFQFQISHPGIQISALPNLSSYSTLGAGDFNHDGNSDIVLQNNASGKMEIWYMGNGNIIGDYSYGNLSAYAMLGSGDFNGDGNSDIVWRNKFSGQAEIWAFNSNGAIVADTPIGNLSGYNLIGTGDVNGDGTSDIIWQNKSTGLAEIWMMSSNHATADVGIGNLSAYNLIATADLNHDHQTDLVWQNKTTGNVDVWFMGNGHTIADYDYGNLSNYRLLATGDINQDGTNDLLWQNKSTGEVSDWIIGPQTGRLSSSQSFGTQPLKFQETANGFNHDASPDVMWQDSGTGQTQFWNINQHDNLIVV